MCQLPPTKHTDTCCIGRFCSHKFSLPCTEKLGLLLDDLTTGSQLELLESKIDFADFGDFDFYRLCLVFLLRDLDVLLHLLIQTRYHRAYKPPGPLLRLDNGSGILLRKMCWLQLKTDNLIKYVKMPSMHSDAVLVTVQDESFQTFSRWRVTGQLLAFSSQLHVLPMGHQVGQILLRELYA